MNYYDIEVLLNEERIERLRRDAQRHRLAALAIRSGQEKSRLSGIKRIWEITGSRASNLFSKPRREAEESYDQPGFES